MSDDNGHGSRRTYQRGCRCQRCRDGAADYMRKRRAKIVSARSEAEGVNAKSKPKLVGLPTNTAPVAVKEPVMGEVEAAVREQIANSTAAAEHAGIAAAAIALARKIDDDDFAAQLGQNVTRLDKLLATLGKPKKKMNNRLVAVSAMAKRRAL